MKQRVLKRALCALCALFALLALPGGAVAARAPIPTPFVGASVANRALPCGVGFALSRTQKERMRSLLEQIPGKELPSRGEKNSPPTPQQRAQAWLSVLSDRQKVGQLLLARFPLSGAPALADRLELGGYLLFARDVADLTPDALRALLESCQSQTLVPMLMGVDEEGGQVVRVSRYRQYRESPFPSPRSLLSKGGLDAVERDAREKAQLLLSLGLNLNLGPVCDIAGDKNAFLYARSAGDDAASVSDFVRQVVQSSREEGLGCVLKHFPGYGNNADTHVGKAVDERPYESFVQRDFLPFEAGIAAGAGAVMVSHNTVACMDAQLPASLSPAVHEILRGQLRFEGVIVTDDLAMAAVSQGADQGQLAVQAVLAGNDLLCTSDPEQAAAALLDALEQGRLSAERLDEAVTRVLVWKLSLGLLS